MYIITLKFTEWTLTRMLRFIILGLAALTFALVANAQFGKPKATPRTLAEITAERALADGTRRMQTIAGDVATLEQIDIDFAQQRLDEAYAGYTELCEDRSAPSDYWARNCFKLANLYRRGIAVSQDYSKAQDLYEELCLEQNHAEACTQQAYISFTGRNGSKDFANARKLYTVACNLKNAAGCGGLGAMTYAGQGGLMDKREGERLLQRSCRGGYDWACSRLVDVGGCRYSRYGNLSEAAKELCNRAGQ